MTLRERLAHAADERRLAVETSGRCVFAERLVIGCCERQYRCHHLERAGNVYDPDQCNCTCPGFRHGRGAGSGPRAADASRRAAVAE